MGKLVKADLYGQWRQMKVYIYTLLFLFIYVIFSTIGNIEWSTAIKVGDLTNLILKQQSIIVFIAMIGVTSYYIGRLFSNKFIHMQVVSCKKREKVIFAKYFVQGIANMIIFTVVLIVALTALTFVYEIDYSAGSEVFLQWSLIMVLTIRYTISIVSIVFIIKNGAFAALANWLITVAEMFPMMVGIEYGNDRLVEFSRLFTVGQINMIATNAIDSMMILKILVTTIVELVFYICVTYYSFKKAELV